MPRAKKSKKKCRKEGIHSRSEAIRRVILDVVADVIQCCMDTVDDMPECVTQHAETLNNNALLLHMSNSAHDVYTTLSREEQEKILSTTQQALKELGDSLRKIYRIVDPREEDDDCGPQ